MGYFENTVAGKITEPRVVFFLATFYNLPWPPQSVYRQIKIKIDPFTNVHLTLECIPGHFRTERRL